MQTLSLQTDMRAEPVRRLLALGESHTLGANVTSIDKCWVNQVARLLEEFQGSPIELINQGIGSNVITPECPSYDASVKPSGLERVDEELIALQPDMVLLSYGLNDSRGGTSVEVFRRACQELIDRIKAGTQALIVLLNVYYMREVVYSIPRWDSSNYDGTDVYNLMIRQVAEKNGLILADIYAAEVGVDWIIDGGGCHANDLGHRLIAHRVFEAIARNCSFVARTLLGKSPQKEFVPRYGMGPDRPGPQSIALEQAGKRPPFLKR